jgi:hypothetical protein
MPENLPHLVATLSEMAILFGAIALMLKGATEIVDAFDRFTARFWHLLRTLGRRTRR